MELKYSSLHKQLFDFLDKNFIFYPSWGNPDSRGNPYGLGNPDEFFSYFHRPDYPNTPVTFLKIVPKPVQLYKLVADDETKINVQLAIRSP